MQNNFADAEKNEPEGQTHQVNHPLLYEINTRCWLRLLSDQQGRGVTLAECAGFGISTLAATRL